MELKEQSLRSDFLKFIIPSIIAQWVYALYTMVDGIFVAKGVSETALTAVNISSPFLVGLFSLAILFAVGASTIVGILLGEGKKQQASEIFTQNVVMLIILSVIISIAVWGGLDPIARFLGATEATLPFVKEYIGTVAPFSIGFVLSYSFETLIKTDGYPKRATIIVVCGAVANCILDYLLVMVLDKGIWGAAFATGVSQLIVCGLYLKHFLSGQGVIRFTKFRFDFRLVWRQFRNGLSSGITELSAGVIIFFFNRSILKYLGEDALVSYTIISYVNSIVVMSMAGIAQGVQPLTSYYIGKNRKDICDRLLRYSVFAAAVISITTVVGCFLGTNAIVGLFVSPELTELRQYSVEVFRIFSLSFLLVGYNVVIGGYFTAIEKSLYATLISLGRGLILVLISLVVLANVIGGEGIWWSTLMSELCCLVMTMAFLILHRRQGKRELNTTKNENNKKNIVNHF